MENNKNASQVEAQEETQEVTDVVDEEVSTSEDHQNESDSGNHNQKGDKQADDETTDSDDENQDPKEGEEVESEDDDDESEALVPLSKLRKVRNEAKNLRDRLKAAETEIETLKTGGTNQDLVNEVATLTSTLRTERLAQLISSEATKNGAIEPAAIAKLIDQNAVEWEENKPTNISKVLEATKKTYPKLFSATQGSGNLGSRDEPRARTEGMSATAVLADAYSQSE